MKSLIGLVLLVALAGCVQNNVFELSLGDCFDDDGALSEEVSEVPLVECSEPHDNEVYSIHEMTDTTYPGFEASGERADGLCIDDFEPFVGTPYELSELNIGWLVPTDVSWANGDREILCFLYRVDLEQMTGTMEDSGA